MNKTKQTTSVCIPSVKLLGDYWSLRIIDALRSEEKRFCNLQRELDNVNPVTLTARLKKLESANVILRKQEALDKLSVTYSLSDIGKEALTVVDAINTFSVKAARES